MSMLVGTSELGASVTTLSKVVQSLTEIDLGQPFQVGPHTEGVRFALLVIYQELRTLAVQLAELRREQGPPLTRAQHALGQYNTAYRELNAHLLRATEDSYDLSPAPGEWELRTVYGHMVGVERNFHALVDYGWRRQQPGTGLPATFPEGETNRLLGPYGDFRKLVDTGSLRDMQEYHEQLRQRTLDHFGAISDSELDGPSVWWEGEPFSLEYRLHRFDAHLRQHTIQVEKTLTLLSVPATEAYRLLHINYSALAEVESSLIGTSELRAALYVGRPPIATQLIDAGAELSVHDAAALGRLELLIELLDGEGDWLLDEYSRDGYTNLQLASFFGHTDVALFLLERGANANLIARNSMLIQAIHAAAAGGHIAIVRALLAHSANANAAQQNNFRPLHAAAQNGDMALTVLLLENGADPSLTNADGQTPRAIALETNHVSVAEKLQITGEKK